MTTELHEGPLEASPTIAPAKASWREQRRNRRRRRVWFEEILGWILVPAILIGSYWVVEGVLGAVGTSFSAIFSGLTTITSNF
ncbi:hypothetical protein [Microvirga antarctica]|uniref:hypothetical protein n=1 Tax=Microvirga antarctica TaxID=2819233 RepID=UPI001B30BCF4|nr:hypothetical protein [Microvirga antarctica]